MCYASIGASFGRMFRLISPALLLMAFVGCDSFLEVEPDPNAISGDGIKGEGAFQSRLIGSTSDFAVGAADAAVYGGLFADELIWGGSFVRRDEIDRRSIDPANDIVANEPYTTLQIAATTSKGLQEDILDGAFPTFVSDPENSEELARVSLFSGYTRLYLADLFCTLAFNNTGPELTSAEVYSLAIEDFTLAINAADAGSDIRNTALVGRARAELQLGQDSEALADANQVGEGFEFELEYSGNTGRETNTVWSFTWGNRRLVVGPPYHDLTIDDTAIPDPRPTVVDAGQSSFSGAYQLMATEKHGSRSSPLRLASWIEVQFIIAEIEGGDAARDILDELRVLHGIATPVDPAETATEEDMLRKIADEKARTLLLEGHRMGDSRRFLERYSIDLFPSSPQHGDQTCMPLPDLERDNNPGIS